MPAKPVSVDALARELRQFDSVGVAMLYGSRAQDHASETSDIDVAVAGPRPLSIDERAAIASKVSDAFGLEVDVLDLRTAHGPVLEQAMSEGLPLFVADKPLYAELLRKLWYQQADMMPYYDRILAERRRRFLDG